MVVGDDLVEHGGEKGALGQANPGIVGVDPSFAHFQRGRRQRLRVDRQLAVLDDNVRAVGGQLAGSQAGHVDNRTVAQSQRTAFGNGDVAALGLGVESHAEIGAGDVQRAHLQLLVVDQRSGKADLHRGPGRRERGVLHLQVGADQVQRSAVGDGDVPLRPRAGEVQGAGDSQAVREDGVGRAQRAVGADADVGHVHPVHGHHPIHVQIAFTAYRPHDIQVVILVGFQREGGAAVDGNAVVVRAAESDRQRANSTDARRMGRKRAVGVHHHRVVVGDAHLVRFAGQHRLAAAGCQQGTAEGIVAGAHQADQATFRGHQGQAVHVPGLESRATEHQVFGTLLEELGLDAVAV